MVSLRTETMVARSSAVRPRTQKKSPVPKKRGAKSVSPSGRQSSNASVIESVNKELYKRNAELAVRNKTLALLRKLDEISMTTIGMDDMARQIAGVIGLELGYEVVSVALIRDDHGKKLLQWLSLESPVPEIDATLHQFLPRTVDAPLRSMNMLGQVLSTGEPMMSDIRSVYPKPIASTLLDVGKGVRQLLSSMVYPLRVGADPIGVLTLSASRDLADLTAYEHDAIEGITGLVSLAIFKAKLYEDLQNTTQELRVVNQKLEQLDKAKSEFLSIASHQLYTPLTAIKGYLSMLQGKDFGEVPAQVQPIIDILQKSSDRLIDLIRSLLDVSRIESGRLVLQLVSVDVKSMVHDLVIELLPNAQKKNLKLNFEEPKETLPHAVVDQTRIRQVLLNTLDNAIKYTEKGNVDVRIYKEGDFLYYAVTDTGRGIAPEEINSLFTKFTRVGGAQKYRTEGTGLGLYVARQIIREHHGDIIVTSPGMGKGSTFTVKLPIEGTKDSLKAGEKVQVGIKAAETGQAPQESAPQVVSSPSPSIPSAAPETPPVSPPSASVSSESSTTPPTSSVPPSSPSAKPSA